MLTHTRGVKYQLLCLSLKKSYVENMLSRIHTSEKKPLTRCLCLKIDSLVNRQQKNKTSYYGWNKTNQENLKSRNI
jgi:hypothetical protein